MGDHGSIDVVCSICGKADRVAVDTYANEYEELRHHHAVHHICSACQEKIRSDAIHDHEHGEG